MSEGSPRKGRNRIEELADRLAGQGRAGEIEGELERLDPDDLGPSERESWFHLWGVTAFQRGDRDAAFARFQAAHKACPESSLIAFSLGQEHEARAEPERMFALFDLSTFPKVPPRYALAQARYAYLWHDFSRAQSYVEPILEAYRSLRIVDDTFLYLRGLPFFSQTWAYLAAFLELLGELAELEAETEELGSALSDYDCSDELALIRAIRTEDFSDLVREPHRGTAYERTRAAVLLSLDAEYGEAIGRLDDVGLTDQDFPWLADVLLLAKAAAAHRAGSKDEQELVSDFFARQPLLFEPDHAFNFRLLEYQEVLKLSYGERRRRPGRS